MRLEHLLSEEYERGFVASARRKPSITTDTSFLKKKKNKGRHSGTRRSALAFLTSLGYVLLNYRTDVGIWEPAQAWGSTLRDSTPPVRTVLRPHPGKRSLTCWKRKQSSKERIPAMRQCPREAGVEATVYSRSDKSSVRRGESRKGRMADA